MVSELGLPKDQLQITRMQKIYYKLTMNKNIRHITRLPVSDDAVVLTLFEMLLLLV